MSCLLMGPNAKLHSCLLHHEHVRLYLYLGAGMGGGGGRIRNTFHSLLFKTIFEADMTGPDRTDGFLCQ